MSLGRYIRTIKFCPSLSSIALTNIARGNRSMLGHKPIEHFQVSRNGHTYYETRMDDTEISQFLKRYNIHQDKYHIIDEKLSTMNIYLGKYDHISLLDLDMIDEVWTLTGFPTGFISQHPPKPRLTLTTDDPDFNSHA